MLPTRCLCAGCSCGDTCGSAAGGVLPHGPTTGKTGPCAASHWKDQTVLNHPNFERQGAPLSPMHTQMCSFEDAVSAPLFCTSPQCHQIGLTAARGSKLTDQPLSMWSCVLPRTSQSLYNKRFSMMSELGITLYSCFLLEVEATCLEVSAALCPSAQRHGNPLLLWQALRAFLGCWHFVITKIALIL